MKWTDEQSVRRAAELLKASASVATEAARLLYGTKRWKSWSKDTNLLAAHLQTKAESLDAEVSDSPIVTDEHEWPARSGIVDASSHETDDSSLGS